MSIINTMSLAGTISLAFYYFVKLLFREKYSAYGKMVLLKISMFFYLCPIQLMKYLLPEDAVTYFPEFYGIPVEEMLHLGETGYITIQNLSGQYVACPVWKIVLVIVWISLVLLFILYELIQYFRMKYLTIRCSEKVELAGRFSSAEEVKRYPDKKRHSVQVLSSCVVDSPFTMGVIKPRIFIPETELEDKEMEMIYEHEMTHIKNHDILVKFLCLIIILLHWFNPFSYLVLFEFNVLSEYCCDESIMRTRSLEDRKIYALMLVRFATERTASSKTFWTKCFSGSKKRLKERIGAVLEMKKRKSWVIVVAAILSMILSATTVYAYKTETTLIADYGAGYLDDGEYSWNLDEDLIWEFSISDNVFIDNSGNIFYSTDTQDAEPYVICIHSYVDGVWKEHLRNSSGGCVINKYASKRCMKCGQIVVGDLVSSEYFVKCTH